jgi:hypothetical protein
MTGSARTSNRLGRAARRLLRPLCVALSVYVFFAVADADVTNPPAYAVAKWSTVALSTAWALAGLGAVFTEPKRRRS